MKKEDKPQKRRILADLDELVAVTNNQTEIEKADFFEQDKSAKTLGQKIINPTITGKNIDDESINKRQKILKKLFTAVFVIFVLGVLVFTFYNDFIAPSEDRDPLLWSDLMKIFSVGWMYLLFAFICLFLCYFFKALKLSILCKSLTNAWHFKTCFETAIIGHYYNYVTPLAVGGQPFEIYHLSNHGVHGGVAASLPIATYALNQFAFVILSIVFLALFKNNTLQVNDALLSAFPVAFNYLAIAGACVCVIMPFLIIVFSLMPKFGTKLVKSVMNIGSKLKIVKDPQKTTDLTIKNLVQNAQCIRKMFHMPLTSLLCFVLSFLEHLASASIAYFVLKVFCFPTFTQSVPMVLEWLQVVQFVLIISCSVSFVPTPGNTGAADLSFYMLFTAGLASGLAFPAMVTWRVLGYYSFILIGFIFATIRKRVDRRIRRRKQNQE